MLDADFSRSKFIEDGDPQQRCRALSATLTKRLEDATNSHQAVEWIIADLRGIGHEVTLWDSILSDAWTEPKHDQYLWVVLDSDADDREDDEDDPGDIRWTSAAVSFRPRLRDLPKRCPQCFSALTECDIRLRIQGHGSAVAPALRVQFESPGIMPLDALVGAESLDVRRGGFCCGSCGSAWFPPPR